MLSPFPDYGEMFYSFHGTYPEFATEIVNGNIDVTIGGGELGRGFYSGQHAHEAKAWAFHVSKTKTDNVVRLEQPSVCDFFGFEILNLDIKEATAIRNNLKSENTKKTYVSGVDLVVSPIIGITDAYGVPKAKSGGQVKWESVLSEIYLNGDRTKRSILPW